jgi:hypothetical protein
MVTVTEWVRTAMTLIPQFILAPLKYVVTGWMKTVMGQMQFVRQSVNALTATEMDIIH